MHEQSCAPCLARTQQELKARTEMLQARVMDSRRSEEALRKARNIWRIVALIALAGLLAWAAFASISAGIERGIAWGETTEAEAYWKSINEEMYR